MRSILTLSEMYIAVRRLTAASPIMKDSAMSVLTTRVVEGTWGTDCVTGMI